VLAPGSDAVRLSLPSTKIGIDGLLLSIGETIEAVKVPVEAELCGRGIAYLCIYQTSVASKPWLPSTNPPVEIWVLSFTASPPRELLCLGDTAISLCFSTSYSW